MSTPGPRVRLLYVPDCPNVDHARAMLAECLRQLELEVAVDEDCGEWASPAIVIDGKDVMGRLDVHGSECRLDVPTKDRVLAALQKLKT